MLEKVRKGVQAQDGVLPVGSAHDDQFQLRQQRQAEEQTAVRRQKVQVQKILLAVELLGTSQLIYLFLKLVFFFCIIS